MVNGSVGALHVALAAAVVGWIVFSLSHSVTVWKKRNAEQSAPRSLYLLIIALGVGAAALAGGWLNRELERRAGIVSGTDFFVVRAHTGATPHLADGDSLSSGAALVTFDAPEAQREEQRLRSEIAVLEQQMRVKTLQPLALNPELLRRSEQVNDAQRARLTELGFGTLGTSGHVSVTDPAAAERAKSRAADLELERTTELVEDGVLAREKLDAATAAAQTAAQQLHEREQLFDAAQAGSQAVRRSESEISHDSGRASAERSAEVDELAARLAGLHADLQQLLSQQSVKAPFSGTVVYRHPSPALAGNGEVILALAKGAGFVAAVQVPARDTAMLRAGQQLSLKLEHSLVSDQISGRLASISPAAGSNDRADLLIECNLPAEQFAAFSSGSVPVTLSWRPPLYSVPFTRWGFTVAALVILFWLFPQVKYARRRLSQANAQSRQQASPLEGRDRQDCGEPRKEEVDHILAQLDRSVEAAGAAR